ncbi:MAG: peptidoglycan-binding protein [Deltaproteobacteria bacterium]|nr:peptidoglycan-binding protein [Deltaproteobacteria bacterium]
MTKQKYTGTPLTVRIGEVSTVELPAHVFRVRLTGFLFEIDKTFLLPSAMKGIRGLVNYYNKHPGMSVVVTGHTDRLGDDAYNVALSGERAQSVGHYLQDEVDPWLACYQGSPHSKIWGTREDQHMLTAIKDGAGQPYYTGEVHGQLDPVTQDGVRRYQQDRSLTVDGFPGPQTRRALVTDYMGLDGTTLPPEASLETLGCGEHHNEVPTEDNVEEPRNRRVEVFLFEGPPDPPNPGTCPDASCAYHEWVRRAIETVDFDHDAPTSTTELRIRILGVSRDGQGDAVYRLTVGGMKRVGRTDSDGWLVEPDVGEHEKCVVEWATDEELSRNGDYTYRLEVDMKSDGDDDEAARRRLNNLGYAPSVVLDGAVRAFQLDYKLPATGKLDGATRARLTEVHDNQLSGSAV